jgi:hypothetical protein
LISPPLTAIVLVLLMMLFCGMLMVESGFATLSLDEGVSPKTYTNDYYGISIQYPFSWLIREGDTDPNDRVTDIVTISEQETGYTGDLRLSIDPDQTGSLSQYLTDYINHLEVNYDDFELIDSSTNFVLAGRPAYRLVYSYEGEYSDGENADLMEMEIGTKIGNDYYYVRYFADTESYSNELVLAQDIIDSFRIGQDRSRLD